MADGALGCWQLLLEVSTSFTAPAIIELDFSRASHAVIDGGYWWPINNTIPYCYMTHA